jgi:hypothetical protein
VTKTTVAAAFAVGLALAGAVVFPADAAMRHGCGSHGGGSHGAIQRGNFRGGGSGHGGGYGGYARGYGGYGGAVPFPRGLDYGLLLLTQGSDETQIRGD